MVLRTAIDIIVVPDLAELGLAGVLGTLASLGLVVRKAGAANVRDGAVLLLQSTLDVSKGVGGAVGGLDAGVREPGEGGQVVPVLDDGLEELEEVVVLVVLGAETLGLEGAVAGGVLGELVAPELPVGLVLGDPVLVHEGQEVQLAVPGEPLVDGLALVWRDGGAARLAVGGVGARRRVILAAQVAVLGVRAVAEIGPESVDGPALLGKVLALLLETGVDGPELGLQLGERMAG